MSIFQKKIAAKNETTLPKDETTSSKPKDTKKSIAKPQPKVVTSKPTGNSKTPLKTELVKHNISHDNKPKDIQVKDVAAKELKENQESIKASVEVVPILNYPKSKWNFFSNDLLIQCHLYLARVFSKQKDFAKAEELFKNVIIMNSKVIYHL